MKFRLTLFSLLLVVLLSCEQSNHGIEGTWTHIKAIEIGAESLKPSGEQYGTHQIQFTPSGEIVYLERGKREGKGNNYYHLRGDSIHGIHIELDSNNHSDTTVLKSSKYILDQDALKVFGDDKVYYYKRD